MTSGGLPPERLTEKKCPVYALGCIVSRPDDEDAWCDRCIRQSLRATRRERDDLIIVLGNRNTQAEQLAAEVSRLQQRERQLEDALQNIVDQAYPPDTWFTDIAREALGQG